MRFLQEAYELNHLMALRPVLFWLVFCCTSLFALSNDNPSAPNLPEFGILSDREAWLGWKFGYEWDMVMSKRIKVKSQKISQGEEEEKGRTLGMLDRFDRYRTQKNFGVLTFNMSDRVELYGKLGLMQLTLAATFTDSVRLKIKTKNAFTWGIGGRVILIYWKEVVMGVNAWYQHAGLGVNQLSQNGAMIPPQRAHVNYDEWQIGIGFSREIGMFCPYAGLAYAALFGSLRHLEQYSSIEIKNRQPFILLLGVGITAKKAIAFNVESRLIGEKAVTVTGQFRF